MDPTDIGLFRVAERRLRWVDARQALLAQNVANANTPGFQPKDLAPFAVTLDAQTLATTNAAHLQGTTGGLAGSTQRSEARAPNGNSISIEEQLTKVADTDGIQALVLNLDRTYQSMFRTALGRQS